MHKGGREYRRLVGAFERIFGATIFFGTDGQVGRARRSYGTLCFLARGTNLVRPR
jgi:hypothetical protein